MTFLETTLSALTALKVNKARSFLTILGIIIGVFAVLALVSLVQGVKNYIADEFNSIGSNLILIAPGRVSFGRDPSVAFANSKLTDKDSDNINRDAADFIVAATPNIRLSKSVSYKSNNFLANIVGTNSKFLQITNFEIDKGRGFTKAEETTSARLAVIGPTVAKNLFKDDPINKIIKISDANYTVIGVTKPKGYNADERVIVPYTSLEKTMGIKKLSGITIKTKPDQNIDEAMQKIELILLQTHKKDEFSVLSQRDILNSFDNILKTLSIGLGAVAGISLLVGGIGIMNIMLVSVNERISEIGLRKAVGASTSDIAIQFILEATFLSVIGGVIGIGLGIASTFAMRSFLRAEVPLWAILLASGFSLVVGIGFGSYPAIAAGKKDPVESLRHEI